MKQHLGRSPTSAKSKSRESECGYKLRVVLNWEAEFEKVDGWDKSKGVHIYWPDT